MNRETLLMVADSEHCADMLYAVGIFVPDPFIYLRCGSRPYASVERLGNRPRPVPGAALPSPVAEPVSEETAEGRHQEAGAAHVIREILRETRREESLCPASFPAWAGARTAKDENPREAQARPVFPRTRNQVVRGSEKNQRRPDDG